MPAIDFPNSPTLNQVFSSGGKSWRWDGTAWVMVVSLVEVNVEPSTTNIDGGEPDTIQFYDIGALDGGTV
jgi:hypothetical protein